MTDTSVVLRALEDLNFKDACKNSNYDIVYSSPWAPHVDIEIQVSPAEDVMDLDSFVEVAARAWLLKKCLLSLR